MKKFSKTGGVFAAIFLIFCLLSIIFFLRGNGRSLDIIGYVTFPFSLASYYLGVAIQSEFGLSYAALNFFEVLADASLGLFEFYFFGWILERPFRRQ